MVLVQSRRDNVEKEKKPRLSLFLPLLSAWKHASKRISPAAL